MFKIMSIGIPPQAGQVFVCYVGRIRGEVLFYKVTSVLQNFRVYVREVQAEKLQAPSARRPGIVAPLPEAFVGEAREIAYRRIEGSLRLDMAEVFSGPVYTWLWTGKPVLFAQKRNPARGMTPEPCVQQEGGAA
ncbi:MAG: hypothetical protein MRY74_02725 [Neomegalonema sp.]|nr:hypothetical protein [Neomegalonema sp.]